VLAQVVFVALGVAVAELEAGPAVGLTVFSAAALAVGLVLGGFVTTAATGSST
jgi:hypothetical protein